MPASGAPWNSAPRFHSRFPQKLKPATRPLVPTHLGAWKELRFHNEHKFNLEEYIVELEEPVGLSLAPDLDGNVYVVKVHNGSSAHLSRVVAEGDFIKKCADGWGEWLSDCTDLKQVMRVLQKKKLKLRLLLERREDRNAEDARWHRQGKVGQAGSAVSGLLRPLHFMGNTDHEWISPSSGKSLMLFFHRTVVGEDKRRPKGLVRSEKAAMLRKELMEALALAAYDLSSPMVQEHSSEMDIPGWKESLVTLASNSVPYRRTSLLPCGTKATQSPRKSDEPHGQRTKLVTPVLPWLLVSNTELTQSELVDLAGRCGLQSLLELQLEPCQGGLSVVGSCWKNTKVDAFVTALGTLHRLVKRREAILKDSDDTFGTCSILLHCTNGMDCVVTTLIAAYCFLYGWMHIHESIHFAEVAMQVKSSKELLQHVTAFLEKQAEERRTGVTVAWPYGGASVEVAGDLVGGWNQRSALSMCPSNPSPCQNSPPGTHFVRIKGLQPGLYYYKFIVDGAWEVDYLGPKAMDDSGNWNNILYVRSNGTRIVPTKPEDLVRVEAALVALRTKCG